MVREEVGEGRTVFGSDRFDQGTSFGPESFELHDLTGAFYLPLHHHLRSSETKEEQTVCRS